MKKIIYRTGALLLPVFICSLLSFRSRHTAAPQARADTTRPLHLCTEIPFDNYKSLPEQLRYFRFLAAYNKQFSLTGPAALSAQRTLTAAEETQVHEYIARNIHWNKKELVIRFKESGYETEKERIKKTAAQWEQCCNIRFRYSQSLPADIIISLEGRINQSHIGTDAKGYNPSMWLCLGPNDSQSEYDRVVLHEFGHVLGFVHEHQVDDKNPLIWNIPFVISYYKKLDTVYDSAWTIKNVIMRYSKTQVRGTAYDPKSIMCYEIPKGFLSGIKEQLPANTRLSDSDKSYAARTYK